MGALEVLQDAVQADGLRQRMVEIERASERYGSWSMQVGAVLFDRSRGGVGPRPGALLKTWQLALEAPSLR